MSKYLTGEATYKDGRLLKLAIFCTDEPDEEMQTLGLLHWTYVESVDRVIEFLKEGDTLVASFQEGDDVPVEVVTVDDVETLEVVQFGQNSERSSLRNLPPIPD